MLDKRHLGVVSRSSGLQLECLGFFWLSRNFLLEEFLYIFGDAVRSDGSSTLVSCLYEINNC